MIWSSQRSSFGAAGVGAAVLIVSVLPLFLTGAMAVQIGADLAFGASGLGIAVAMYWATNALTSVHLGRVADRMGAVWSMRVAAVVAGVAALGVATASSRWWHLVIWLMVGGTSHAIAQPATNRLLVHVVRPERLGVAFGFKGSAPPAAAMLAGLAVPVIALTLGWRWAFIISAALAVVVLPMVGSRPPPAERARRLDIAQGSLGDRRIVLSIAGAFGLAVAVSTTVPTFFVDAVVRSGGSSQLAGTMLAVASASAIATRVVSGFVCDRLVTGHLRVCSTLLAMGAIGLVLLASGRPGPMAVGVVIALIGTWGFNAIFWYAVVSAYRDVPGKITGAIQPGAAVGGVGGPLLSGIIADNVGYGAAWTFVCAITVCAAIAMYWGSRQLL